MIKYICDVCKEEIGRQEDIGAFSYLDSVMTIDGKRNLTEKKHIFCGECRDTVKNYMEELGKKAILKDSKMEITKVKK